MEFQNGSCQDADKFVISGISGTFPESRNVAELKENLYNKVDMITEENKRWHMDHPDVPKRTGEIPNIEKIDNGFFGLHYRQADNMCPMVRITLEKAIEAIFDAGLHPSDLEGTKTGVFLGTAFSETDAALVPRIMSIPPQSFSITGATRSMVSHRISYYLKLKGPSFICDTACSSSMIALTEAFKALKNGLCDQAIVGGANLTLCPLITVQFMKLGVLNKEAKCKVFDEAGNGYVRSETVAVIFIQKIKNAKRNYGELVYAKSNCDGFKPESVNFPSKEAQGQLLRDCYTESGVNPEDLSYLEAHGTGTTVGDPEEAAAIESAIVSKRSKPLLVGSVKSNLGHSEASSGVTSIIKSIFAMEDKIIPPNLHFNNPRKGIKALEDGRMKVVTENTKLEDGQITVGVSSFGFGGANGHAILRSNTRHKANKGLPSDDLPRLVCISGRTNESVETILDDLKSRQLDAEYVRLYHEIFRKNIKEHWFRGYTILSKSGEISRSISKLSETKRHFYLVFGDSSQGWLSNVSDLFNISIFKETIEIMHEKLLKVSVNLLKILTEVKSSVKEETFATISVQIAFIHILKSLKIQPDCYMGIGIGELLCGYFDNCLSLDEVIQAVHQVILFRERMSCQNGEQKTSNKNNIILDKLQEIITHPKSRSNKWLSTNQIKTASAEYFAESIFSNYQDRSKEIRHCTSLLFIGNVPVSQFESPKLEILTLKINPKNVIATLLEVLGSLYDLGVDIELEKLYPHIEFPVSRATPMISPLIKWNYERDHYVGYGSEKYISAGEKVVIVNITNTEWNYISGHMIEERNLFPATGYLYLVMYAMATQTLRLISDVKVVFENCKFLRATTITPEKSFSFLVSIQVGSGNFEIIQGGSVVVKGKLYVDDDISKEFFLPIAKDQCSKKIDEIKLDSRDVYKELRLRGYNYKGAFRQVREVSLDLQNAKVKWDGNWVAFMDNLLQTKILQLDTRSLYVPTEIDRFVIDSTNHMVYIKSFENENPDLPVRICNKTNTIRCGGIEIRGLKASPIARKKILEDPVLEKYQFIPNETNLPLGEAVRVNIQIALENVPSVKVKAVELAENCLNEDSLLSPIIYKTLLDLPAIQPDVTVLSSEKFELEGINVVNKPISAETDCNLITGNNILLRPTCLEEALNALKDNGFIMSREQSDFDVSKIRSDKFEILTIYAVEDNQLVLVQKSKISSTVGSTNTSAIIEISNSTGFKWVKSLQDAIASKKNVILYSQNEPLSGIMGLVNCIRREPGKNNIRCVFTIGDAPQFDLNHPFYVKQLKKNIAINVFKDSKWGTYRHLCLEKLDEVCVEHCFVNNLVRGDLSSLKWIEGPLSTDTKTDKDKIYVYYAALNFKDIMLASGRIFNTSGSRIEEECDLGLEFSGKTTSGERVMGMRSGGSLSTLLKKDNGLFWRVPDKWTLEEAATVPCVYATVLYGISMRSKLRKGHSILIHSGAGGIGIAAISLALHKGCRVYTTVGTTEKREFLKRFFPQLKDEQIFYSRDTSFKEAIHKATNGRGVDFVLNSLAEDKLYASVRCLAKGGTFLEIGKYDIINNSKLKLILFEKRISFNGIFLDVFLNASEEEKNELQKLLIEGIENGSVRPLPTRVFQEDEIEEAFRYMTTGKHIGKNLIKIREEEKNLNAVPKSIIRKCIPRYNCNEDYVYVITGGLGGFGLELADWLILRGARRLVLTSRKGVTTGYQALRIETWKSYGVTVNVSTADITIKSGCEGLIKEAKSLGPIAALFNLAVVLQDAIFENQSEESFKTSFGPKACATAYLDQLTRKYCPELRDFVVFSSVSCGRGNAGQTNYGMSNSVMERICEQRRLDGYPGLAIEWGAIGDVGIVADMQEEHLTEMEIGGTLQQRISSCLQVLDIFLKQKNPLVSSIVVSKKKDGVGSGGNLVNVVARILGIKDLKTISQQAKLSELGMDSMTGVEIQQTLERDFQYAITAQEIRNLTFAGLQVLQDELSQTEEDKSSENTKQNGFEAFLHKFVAEEETALRPILQLTSKTDKSSKDIQLIFFPGLEGSATILESLSKNLSVPSMAVQLTPDVTKNSIEETADCILSMVENLIPNSKQFRIVAYSYGTLSALEIVSKLEKKGYKGKIICIDASPRMIIQMHENSEQKQSQFEVKVLLQIASAIIPQDIVAANKEKVLGCDNLEEKLDIIEDIVPSTSKYSRTFVRNTVEALYKRITMVKNYQPNYKIQSKVTLCKPTEAIMPEMVEDYYLSEICVDPVEVKIFNGNHLSVLENVELANSIMDWL